MHSKSKPSDKSSANSFMDNTHRISGLILSGSLNIAVKLKSIGAKLDLLIQELAEKLNKGTTDPVYCRNTAISLDKILNELAAITMELDKKPLNIRKELDKIKEKTWTITEALDEYSQARFNISVKQS